MYQENRIATTTFITDLTAQLYHRALKTAAASVRAEMVFKRSEKYRTALTLEAAAYETEAQKLATAFPSIGA